MFDINTKEIEWCGKKLKFETGKIARQANATVIVTYGGTTVMANVTITVAFACLAILPVSNFNFLPHHSISFVFISNIFFLYFL
jgi:polyribonucleotide nucleotidyltransferase